MGKKSLEKGTQAPQAIDEERDSFVFVLASVVTERESFSFICSGAKSAERVDYDGGDNEGEPEYIRERREKRSEERERGSDN